MVAKIYNQNTGSPLPSPQSHEHINEPIDIGELHNPDGSAKNHLALLLPEKRSPEASATSLAAHPNRYALELDPDQRSHLSNNLIRDTIEVLPIKPDKITNIAKPLIEASRVEGSDSSFDVQVTHRFRAHIQKNILSIQSAASSDAGPAWEVLETSPTSTSVIRVHQHHNDTAQFDGMQDQTQLKIEEIKSSDESYKPVFEDAGPSHESTWVTVVEDDDYTYNKNIQRNAVAAPFIKNDSTPSITAAAAIKTSMTDHTAVPNTYTSHSTTNSRDKPPPSQDITTTSKSAPLPLSPSMSSLESNFTLRRWELDPSHIQYSKRIAVGGFAEVFLGRYEGTLVAIKSLLDAQDTNYDRFVQEISMLASLRHPNLILFMGFTVKPCLTIVSEYMHRGSLFKVIEHGGGVPLPYQRQRSVAVSVARGMSYLHSRNPPVLHLDLKSPNILIDNQWHIKIADFGLSRVRFNTFLTGTGAGTPQWLSPEVLACKQVNEKADVYSYGVVLWECLTGQAPWEGINPMTVVGAVGFKGQSLPRPPEEADPFLSALCMKCMSRDPEDRPSFHEIVDQLEAEYAPSLHQSMHSTLSESAASLPNGDKGRRNGDQPRLSNDGDQPRLSNDGEHGWRGENNRVQEQNSLTELSPFAAACYAAALPQSVRGYDDGSLGDDGYHQHHDHQQYDHDQDEAIPSPSRDTPFARAPPFDQNTAEGLNGRSADDAVDGDTPFMTGTVTTIVATKIIDTNDDTNGNGIENNKQLHGPSSEKQHYTHPPKTTPTSALSSCEVESCPSSEHMAFLPSAHGGPVVVNVGHSGVSKEEEDKLIASFESAQL